MGAAPHLERASAPGAPEELANGFADAEERQTASMDKIREATTQLGRGASLLTPDMSSSAGVEQRGELPPEAQSPHSRCAYFWLLHPIYHQQALKCQSASPFLPLCAGKRLWSQASGVTTSVLCLQDSAIFPLLKYAVLGLASECWVHLKLLHGPQ